MGHTQGRDGIDGTPLVRGEARQARSPLNCFELFLDNNMLEEIVTNMNKRMKSIVNHLPRGFYESNKLCMKQTSSV